MRRRLCFALLAILSTSAVAQADRSPANYTKIMEVPRGWVWYLNKSSVRPAGTGMYRLWLSGDNRGRSGEVRSAARQIKLRCDRPLYIPLRAVNRGTNNRVLADTLQGDHSSNWIPIEANSPAAAARPWVCRQNVSQSPSGG